MKRIKRGYYNCEMKVITEHPMQLKDFNITDSYFVQMEHSIRQQPGIYLWSHNRWKRTRKYFNEHFEHKNGKVYPKEVRKEM